MAQYKIRLFYKPEVDMLARTAKGVIDIKTGNERMAIDLVKKDILRCSKIIIEVKQ